MAGRRRRRQQREQPPSPTAPQQQGQAWNLVFYQDERGTAPVHGWLRNLARRGIRHVEKVQWGIQLLRDLGLHAPGEYVQSVQGEPGLWELRVTFQRQAYRVFFYNPAERTLVLLHGFLHNRPSIEPELRVTRSRMAEDRQRRGLA